MNGVSHVLWREGLLLLPQHFQQFQLQLQNHVGDRLNMLHDDGNGFASLACDERSLFGGVVRLSDASGVLPDGTPFSLSAENTLPPPRSLDIRSERFREGGAAVLYLCLPTLSEHVSALDADSPRARYCPCAEKVADIFGEAPAREMQFGRHRFLLLFEDEDRSAYVSLPFARIRQDGSGHFTFDPDYCGPVLRLSAARGLAAELCSLSTLLHACVEALSARRSHAPGGLAGFAQGDRIAPRLLDALCTHLPLLDQSLAAAAVHPRRVHELLTRLAGSLCALSTRYSINDLPAYVHCDPGASLRSLCSIAAAIAASDADLPCVLIAATPGSGGQTSCRIRDDALLAAGRFFLSVCSQNMTGKELAVSVMTRIRVAAPQHLDTLVSTALPGLRLVHVSEPPAELPLRQGGVYLRLEQYGDLWNAVRASGSIGWHLPPDMSDLQLELFALR